MKRTMTGVHLTHIYSQNIVIIVLFVSPQRALRKLIIAVCAHPIVSDPPTEFD